jgi:signal transduction histidine kinase
MARDIARNPEKFSSNVHQNLRKNGELVWVSWTNRPMYDQNGVLVEILAVGNEISELKEAEGVLRRDKDAFERLVLERTGELMEAQAELERAKRLSDIGVLAATVAHELRNPLAAIGMAAHNIKRKANNPDLEKHLANIAKKVTESDLIINNLLFYSRIKPPHHEKVKPREILEECIDALKKQGKNGLSLQESLDPIRDTMIEADPVQLREIFNNVLNNARDAVQLKEGLIRITAQEEGRFLAVSVEDNGSGIGKDIVDRIFDPFFTTKAKGTGLGLAVCRQIVDMHQGEIRVKSEPGKGTSILVRLPKGRSLPSGRKRRGNRQAKREEAQTSERA